MLSTVFVFVALATTILPMLLSILLTQFFHPTTQQYQLTKSFSLLVLGMCLSSLATLNFSLAFLVGLFAAPLTYLQPLPGRHFTKSFLAIVTSLTSPTSVLVAGCWYWELSVGEVLKEAAYGWNVWGMNTQLVVWCVWWPAWLVGGVLLWGLPRDEEKTVVNTTALK